MEIIEGNKLIAIFMGAEERPQDKKYNAHLYFNENVAPLITYVSEDRMWSKRKQEHRVAILDLQNLQYHTSWDWLMPVVEKIEAMTNNLKSGGVRIQTLIRSEVPDLQKDEWKYYYAFSIIFNQHPKFRIESDKKIDAVWQGVIQFIQWYNTQSKPTPQ